MTSSHRYGASDTRRSSAVKNSVEPISRMNTVCVPAASSANLQSRICADSLSSANVCETAMPARAASQSGLAASANAPISSGGSAKNSVSSSNAVTGFCGSALSASVNSARRASLRPPAAAASASGKRFSVRAAFPARSADRQSAARAASRSNAAVGSSSARPPSPSFSQSEKSSSKQVFMSLRSRAKRASIRRMR